NTIGGTTPGAGNVISGNTFEGINLDNATVGITAPAPTFIQGNTIGLGANGTTALGNQLYGILVSFDSRNVTIGGPTAAAPNVISANVGFGIITNGGDANGLVIQGNYIGTDRTGEVPQPNTNIGIEIDSPDVLIGGLTDIPGTGPGNVISANGKGPNNGAGIAFSGGDGTGDMVEGNIIGLDAAGTKALND